VNVTATLIGQMITFAVLVWFIKGVLWQPMLRMLDERKKRIADGLAAAERGLKEQELGEKRAVQVIHEAREKANEVIALAQKRAAEIIEEAKEAGRAEGDRMITSAQAELEQEENRTREQLRREVISLALKGAEQILAREVDVTQHRAMLETLAGELQGQSA
jgi:F-type H+-transporting ATPase subunit b